MDMIVNIYILYRIKGFIQGEYHFYSGLGCRGVVITSSEPLFIQIVLQMNPKLFRVTKLVLDIRWIFRKSLFDCHFCILNEVKLHK